MWNQCPYRLLFYRNLFYRNLFYRNLFYRKKIFIFRILWVPPEQSAYGILWGRHEEGAKTYNLLNKSKKLCVSSAHVLRVAPRKAHEQSTGFMRWRHRRAWTSLRLYLIIDLKIITKLYVALWCGIQWCESVRDYPFVIAGTSTLLIIFLF